MKKYIKADSSLAVFWYVDGEFIGPLDTLKGPSVESYGDVLQIDKDHYDEWKSVCKNSGINYSVTPYDFYPRGRILFNTLIHKYVVVADPIIVNDKPIREALKEYYNLPETTIFKSDEHYTSLNSADPDDLISV